MSIRKLFTAVSKGSWGRPDVCETQTYMKRVNIQESLTPPYIQLLPLIPRYHPPGLYPHSEQGGPTGWAGRGRSALETPAPSKHAQTEGGRAEEGGGTCDKGGVGGSDGTKNGHQAGRRDLLARQNPRGTTQSQ